MSQSILPLYCKCRFLSMQNYCGSCGTKTPENARYCGVCGAKFQTQISITKETKNKLTNAVINKDLHNQKHSAWEYLGQAVLFVLILVLVYYGREASLLFAIPWAINVFIMLRHDSRRNKLKYYVLERPCIKKEFVEGDDCPDRWLLWFANMTG